MLPGFLPPEIVACVMWHGQTRHIYTRSAPPPPPGHVCPKVATPVCLTQVSSLAVSHVEHGRTRHGRCSAAQGSPAPRVSPAQGALNEVGAGDGSPPLVVGEAEEEVEHEKNDVLRRQSPPPPG